MRKRRIILFIDKLLSKSLWWQFGALVLLLALLFGLSYMCMFFAKFDWEQFCTEHGMCPKWLLPLYLVIDPNSLNNLYITEPGMHRVDSLMLCISTITYVIGFILFNGLLISVITNTISQRVQKYHDGLTHYLKRNHHIIMGYDDMVPSIIADIFNRDPHGHVMILSSYNVKTIKERLKKSVARNKLDKIIVNYGQKTASEYYKDIHLEAAEDIYVIGYRQLPSHDAVNVECVDSICSYLSGIESKKKPERIICMFEDIDTYAALKTSEIFKKDSNLNIEIIPYNFYAGWSRQIFVRREYKEKGNNPNAKHDYPAIYKKGIGPDDKKHVHMVVVGSNNFASTVALEAAHLHHFPNFEHDKTQKTRITFIDHNADKEMPLFFTRNRHLFEIQPYLYEDMTSPKAVYSPEYHYELLSEDITKNGFLDVEFEFIKGDVFALGIQNLLREWSNDETQYLSIFLAMTDQRNNFIMGMNMPDEIYENEIPIFIRQNRADNFVTNLRKADNMQFSYKNNDMQQAEMRKRRYANIYPFGMEDMAYCFNETSLKRAKLINYIYDYLEKHKKSAKVSQLLEDMKNISSNKLWENAEKSWQTLSVSNKWSNLYCADSIKCKLDSWYAMHNLDNKALKDVIVNLSEDETKEFSMVEHNRWNVEKLLLGFRKSRKNEEGNNNKKLFIHHDIKPFDDLDDDSKYKNVAITSIEWILQMVPEPEKEEN